MRPRLGGDPPGDKGATTSLQSERLHLSAVGGEGSGGRELEVRMGGGCRGTCLFTTWSQAGQLGSG